MGNPLSPLPPPKKKKTSLYKIIKKKKLQNETLPCRDNTGQIIQVVSDRWGDNVIVWHGRFQRSLWDPVATKLQIFATRGLRQWLPQDGLLFGFAQDMLTDQLGDDGVGRPIQLGQKAQAESLRQTRETCVKLYDQKVELSTY